MTRSIADVRKIELDALVDTWVKLLFGENTIGFGFSHRRRYDWLLAYGPFGKPAKNVVWAYLDDGGVRLVIVGMARPRDKEWDVLRTADGSLRYGIPWRWKGQSISVNEVHRYFK